MGAGSNFGESHRFSLLFNLRCSYFLGHPKKKDIEDILEWMLNKDFSTAYRSVFSLKAEKGIALQDILEQVHIYVHRIHFPVDICIHLLDKLANIEHRLSAGTNENLQTGSLVSAFQQAKNMAAGHA